MNRQYPGGVKPSEITPEAVYFDRRAFIKKWSLAAGAAFALQQTNAWAAVKHQAEKSVEGPAWLKEQIARAGQGPATDEALTPYRDVTHYNNFYEFGYDKSDPAKHSGQLNPHPWKVEIAGHAAKTGVFTFEDLVKNLPLEERVYRLRCVEAWSMVIPWVGFSLAQLLKRFEPSSNAKYVAFTTLLDKKQMPGQASRFSTIEWPYREGLRIDEAMHPLTMLVVGLYGRVLPNQNGAPLRLIVPWKYGFKSIKSIVKIEFTEHQPPTSWNMQQPNEYGFYANVNPEVDHPRWSQAQERRLPSGLFSPNILPTQLFNGYQKEVADLYKGMDLKTFY